jgi:hypothetical protein
MKVVAKDYERMSNLILTGDYNGTKVANAITNKSKAIARYIAGLKLTGRNVKYSSDNNRIEGNFDDLGNLAIDLGATVEEIQAVFDATEVPDSYIEKIEALSPMKLDNRFVGKISKAVLDAGCTIKYLKHNGYAVTNEGRFAMERSGRKWTIGYKTEITKQDGSIINFEFDAITDEGFGPTYYEVNFANPLGPFRYNSSSTYGMNVTEFTEQLKDKLKV